MKTLFKTITTLTLGLACGVVAVIGYRSITSYSISASASAASAATATAASAAASSSIGTPTELIIPSIGVDAPIKGVVIDAEGNIGVPADAIHVAWFKGNPRPGAVGVSIIDGHLDTKTAPQAVFYNLDQLAIGDTVEVKTGTSTASGTADASQTFTFTITGTERIPYDASTSQVFASQSTAPQLDLITCTGDWVPAKKIYNERLVVFTRLTGYNGK